MSKINKGARQAAESTNVEQFIEKAVEKQRIRMRGAKRIQLEKVVKTGKPVCSEWYGMENPSVLNISANTLKKLGGINGEKI